jgi:predicted amidohydrolase
MKKNMKVAVVQAKVPTSWQEGEKQVRRLVKKALSEEIDVIGLPEECLAPQSDVRKGYKPFEFLSNIAGQDRVYLFGSNVVKDKGKFYNRGFLFNNKGELILVNDKVVLTPEEIEYYNPGKTIKYVETEFGKMTVLVCKDTFHRYAPWIFKSLMDNEVDIVLNPTLSFNVAPTTIEYYISSLKALSKWFGMYIVAPGTVGKNMTNYISHGHAVVICPMRLVLKEGSFGEEEILYTELEPKYLSEYKKVSFKWQPKEVPKIKVIKK